MDWPGLKELTDRARAQGRWLWYPSRDLWLAPDELDEHVQARRFLWPVENWVLRDPAELLAKARDRVTEAEREVERVKARIFASGKTRPVTAEEATGP